jgi:hypothetical protein
MSALKTRLTAYEALRASNARRRLDLTGQRFGRWLVVSAAPPALQPSGQRKAMFEVLCDCGNASSVSSSRLRSGRSTSCGCWRRELQRGLRLANLVGRAFGKLTALRLASSLSRTAWICQCECGKSCTVRAVNLTTGNTKSCGCEQKAARSKNGSKRAVWFCEIHQLRRVRRGNHTACALCRSELATVQTVRRVFRRVPGFDPSLLPQTFINARRAHLRVRRLIREVAQ